MRGEALDCEGETLELMEAQMGSAQMGPPRFSKMTYKLLMHRSFEVSKDALL